MKQRTALLLAAALTAFVLVLVGGLAARLTRPLAPAPSNAPTDVAVAATVLPALDPTVEALIHAREAAYQAALAEARARLDAANAQIVQANEQVARAATQQQQLPDQLTQAQAAAAPAAVPGAPVPAAVPAYAITPAQAQAIALGAAPGATAGAAPELVSYAGTPAYEVRLDWGLVYVDAQRGTVLYNDAVAPSVAWSAPISPGQASHEDDEHEDDEHEDDEHEGREHKDDD